MRRGNSFIIILSLVILIGIFYQVYNQYKSPRETLLAYKTVVEDGFSTDGLVLRKENVIANYASGFAVYHYQDGMKVSKEVTVATFYNNESDVVNIQKAEEIQRELAMLQNVGVKENHQSYSDVITEQIANMTLNASKNVAQRNLGGIYSERLKLLEYMNSRNVAYGIDLDYSSRIQSLEQQLAQLMSSISVGMEIKAPEAGYYVSRIDGEENILAPDEALGMDVRDFRQVLDRKINRDLISSVGKIITDYDWYYAAVVSKENAKRLEKGARLELKFENDIIERVPAQVYGISEKAGAEECIVVFVCDNMSSSLASMRRKKAQVVFGEYKGLYVPISSIRYAEFESYDYDGEGNIMLDNDNNPVIVDKGAQIVWIKAGSEDLYRKIDVIFSEEDYVLSRILDNEQDFNSYLQEGDRLILDTNGLEVKKPGT
ncbi:MAG: hypothetical protein LBC56_03215 [Oscillospiraceae bacterium]|jgi:hypothetical protein|nr:hypothetical protein [Oscillospiraceae bacterium]